MATAKQEERAPTELAYPGLTADDLCYSWEDGVEGEIRDASKCSRGQAMAHYASETWGDFTRVRCLVRYVILHTRQDIWDGPGRDRWADDLVNDSWGHLSLDDAWAQTPAEPPLGWRPEEGMPCWSVCRRDHPRAIKVWMCEDKDDDQIPNPPARTT